MRGVPAILLSIVAGCTLLWQATDGLSALTTEQVRRQSIAAAPRDLPDVQLFDQNGAAFRLADYQGQRIVVDFIYTRCPTVCRSLGTTFQQLERTLPDEVNLLSVSFDQLHDTSPVLAEYARWQRADGRHWRLARIDDPAALQALLEAFGIVVIPDGLGGYQHNAAIHVVNEAGRLARVLDYDLPVEDLAGQILQPL